MPRRAPRGTAARLPAPGRGRTYPVRMSTFRNPVGPQPPQVYWRRRLLLLIGVVAVIVVILLIVFAPKGGSPSAAQTTTPAATHANTPDPDPSFAATGGAAAACDPSVITLTAITDAASYAATVQPKLSMSIENSGAKPCTLDVGTKAQDYVITSGADSIWNSADCQTGATSNVQTIQPGKTLTTTPFAWDRARSSKDTCSAAKTTQVTAGGASYHLAVKLGDIASASNKQFVLQ
jgi:hypothetical protein